MMHPVNEEDVNRAAPSIHRLGSRRAPTAVRVRRTVFRAEVSLDLDDAPRHALARRRWNDEALSEKLARYFQRVASRVEVAFEFCPASRHVVSVVLLELLSELVELSAE